MDKEEKVGRHCQCSHLDWRGKGCYRVAFPRKFEEMKGALKRKRTEEGGKRNPPGDHPFLETRLIFSWEAGSNKIYPSFQSLFPFLHQLDMNLARQETCHRLPIHTRSDQLPILPPLRSWKPVFVSVVLGSKDFSKYLACPSFRARSLKS